MIHFVRVRILHAKEQLAAAKRPFEVQLTLHEIISKCLEACGSDFAVTMLEVFPDGEEVQRRVTQFLPADFGIIKLSDVAADGLYWVLHDSRAAEQCAMHTVSSCGSLISYKPGKWRPPKFSGEHDAARAAHVASAAIQRHSPRPDFRRAGQ